MTCLLYPYSDELLPLVENAIAFNRNMKIEIVISPKSWVNAIRHSLPHSVSLSTDYYSEVAHVQCVIIAADKTHASYMTEDFVDKIGFALKLSKNVMCCTELSMDFVEHFSELARKNGCSFYYKAKNRTETKQLWSFQQQECVVVGIGCMLRGMDRLNIVVRLAQEYRELGYRVVAVSPNPACTALDFEFMPESLFQVSISFEHTIRVINNYFNDIQLRRQPEIIIVQFPDAMMKWSDFCPEDYAVKAYMLSQAISVDYFVLDAIIDVESMSDFTKMGNVFKSRFGFGIDAVIFEHKQVDDATSFEAEEIAYIPLSSDVASKYIRLAEDMSNDIMFCDFAEIDSYHCIANDMIKKLT